MSPEQAAGADEVDGRTDLYSLGIVLFEAVAGRPPFSGPSAAAVIDMQQHHNPPDLHDLRPDVSPQLAAVVARALEKRPAERWQTADEMRHALLPYTLAAG
jgi:serine/threonine-protein kinase